MSDMISALNDYSNLITATATGVLACLTAFLVIENRALRKAGLSPELVAYLSPSPDGTGAINLVIANVGRGPAFQVSLKLTYDEDDFRFHNAMVDNDPERMPQTVIPQDERFQMLFGISFELYGGKGEGDAEPLKPFCVHLVYKDLLGRTHKRSREIDIRQFAGLRGLLAKSNSRKVADSLEQIERHLGSLARQSSRFTALVDVTKLDDRYVQKEKGEK